MFNDYMSAHWAGFDERRPLTERREALERAVALRETLGLAPRTLARRSRLRGADPLAEELLRVALAAAAAAYA